ncbi:mersacidin/lichenicidin family type 2 lantibiotic [Coleofasciculus sp. E1-EBD-02]|uniref:mersacidin/lichenicidin family type 2 lantibiotic n=1 Tax=Coleofasciculus sp. E1-EBD-02 TaxID=3068481 RepID=UPI0032FB8AEE
MSNIDIIRAWKDEEYRQSLSEEQRSQLPENPAGSLELAEQEMQNLVGGASTSLKNGSQPLQLSLWSWLSNCKNISQAMSSTSTCCCFSI